MNPYIGKRCPYCNSVFKEDDHIVVCSVCDMPHHFECWQDNQGCATFGCTGLISEMIRPDSGAEAVQIPQQTPPTEPATSNPIEATPVSSVPAPKPAEQPEKPIKVLYESKEMVFMADVPLVLTNTAIIIDNAKEKVFARCTFRSITEKAIAAVLIEVACQDVWGNTLGEPVSFQYLDLNTVRDSVFGQTEPIPLTDNVTRKIRVSIKKVLLKDGTVISGGAAAFTLPEPVLLRDHLGSEALAAEYARETTPNARYVPENGGGYWLCACGALNTDDEINCHKCGCTKEQLQTALDPVALESTRLRVAKETEEAAEKERAEQTERIRQAEEQVKLEQEHKAQEIEMTKAEELAKKRRKKIAAVMIIVPVVIIALLLFISFFVLPFSRYLTARSALQSGNFDTAYNIFRDLGDFLNSKELAHEAQYQKAGEKMESTQYSEAIDLFEMLGNYKDSADKLLEAKYLRADQCQTNKEYKESYELYLELDDYKKSQDEVLVTVMLWEAEALGASDTSEADDFSETVKLTSSQYEMFYSTIMVFLTGHENATYWYKWGGTNASKNVKTMLEMLPSYYKDTGTLLKLFTLLARTEGNYSTLFRDNETLMRQCWSLGFVKDLAEQDAAIALFLEGYWTTYSGNYYLNFFKNDDGGTSSNHNLPWTAKPYGTKYFGIHSMVYVWEDENSKELAKVYRFEIVDYDTIRVYCYKDNNTYMLYR